MQGVLFSLKDAVRIIRFNRPNKRNAITQDMYVKITKTLNEDAKNDNVVATIFTGTGDFYSSGNDFKEGMLSSTGNYTETVNKTAGVVESFVSALINYPKLVIAVVNGPAIGIAATSAALCDIVYATEDAYFETPFIKIGICSEGGSSYLFPRILGKSRASEMLFLNKKLSAQEAFQRGFISRVIARSELGELYSELASLGKLPIESVKAIKQLMTGCIKSTLCECNKQENMALKELFAGDAFIGAVTQIFNKKSKL